MKDDEAAVGALLILESLLAAFVMLGALFYLLGAAAGHPPTFLDGDDVVVGRLQQKTEDILDAAREMHVKNRRNLLAPEIVVADDYDLLSAFVADHNAGGDGLKRYVRKFTDASVKSAADVCVGNECRVIWEDREHATTGTAWARRPIDFEFGYAWSGSALSAVGVGQPLPINVVSNGYKGRAPPAQLPLTITSDGLAVSTLVRSSLEGEDESIVTRDGLDTSIRAFELEEMQTFAGGLEFDFHADGLPAGTYVWSFPPSLSVDAVWCPASAVGGWVCASEGSTVVATGEAPALDFFRFRLSRAATEMSPHDVIRLTSLSGRRGYQEFVFDYPSGADTSLRPVLRTSVPDPLPTDGPGFVSVVVVNGPSPVADFDGIRVEGPLGADVFETVTWLNEGTDGITLLEEDGATYGFAAMSGPSVLQPYEVREFAFLIEANAEATLADGRRFVDQRQFASAYDASLVFDSGHSDLAYRSKWYPGVLVAEVPPASVDLDGGAGYPDELGDHVVYVTDRAGRSTSASFEVVALDPEVGLSLRQALEESSVAFDASPLRVGAGGDDDVVVRVDWSALLSDLASRGVASVQDTVRVFAPESLGFNATATFASEEASGARPSVVDVEVGDVTGDGVEEIVVATADDVVTILSRADGSEVGTYAPSAPSELVDVVDARAAGAGRLLVTYSNGSLAIVDGVTLKGRWVALPQVPAAVDVDADAGDAYVAGASLTATGVVHRVPLAAGGGVEFASETLAFTLVDVDAAAGAGEPFLAVADAAGTVLAFDRDGDAFAELTPPLVEAPSAQWGVSPERVVALRVDDVNGGAPDVTLATSLGRVVFQDFVGAHGADTGAFPEDGDAAAGFAVDGGASVAFASRAGVVVRDAVLGAEVSRAAWPDASSMFYGGCNGAEVDQRLSVEPCVPEASTEFTPHAAVALADGPVVALATRGGTLELDAFRDDDILWGVNLGAAEDARLAASSTLLGADALVVGDANGHAWHILAEDGARDWSVPVSELTGEFLYTLTFPPASFLGTYLVEAELAWQETDLYGAEFTQRARVVGLLDVEDASGATNDDLELALTTWYADWER